MAEPLTQVERRLNRHEEAIRRLVDITGLAQYRSEIEEILRGNRTETQEDTTTDIGWYVSDVHCRRAIGYLGAQLAEKGYLSDVRFEQPLLLEMWGEALEKTMDVREPSPIGPDPELAKEKLRNG